MGAALLVAIVFLSQTYKGILAFFEGDDMMNIYGAWVEAPWRLIAGNLIPFTKVYRPVGSLLYRTEFLLFDFNPLPYRIIAYALMLLNIWLLYALARRLSGSREIGVLAALLGSWHHRLVDVYLNNGVIYDILCYTFTIGTLVYYIRRRESGAPCTPGSLAIFYALLVAALNSKEMAIAIPGFLLAYEWIYRGPESWRPAAIAQWLWRETRVVWFSAAIVLPAMLVKMGGGGPFAGNPSYAVHFSIGQFFATSRRFMDELFLLPPETFTTTHVILLWSAILLVAFLSGRKYLKFAALFLLLAPIPVNFIVYRGFFPMYLPLCGWAIFFAGVLVEVRDWILRSQKEGRAGVVSTRQKAYLLLWIAFLMVAAQSQDKFASFDQVTPLKRDIRTFRADLIRLHPSVPKPASMLFLRDPFRLDDWMPAFIVKLTYRDPDIVVHLSKMMDPKPGPEKYSEYGFVFDYRDGRLVQLRP